jgi:hypothetical protein
MPDVIGALEVCCCMVMSKDVFGLLDDERVDTSAIISGCLGVLKNILYVHGVFAIGS